MSSHQVGREINMLRFDLDDKGIRTLGEDLMTKFKSVFDNIATIPSGTHSFANTLKPIADLEAEFSSKTSNCTFPASVNTDKAIRDASRETEQKLSSFGIEQSMREDVYKSILQYKAKNEPLNSDDQRFFDRILRDYKRTGLDLPEDTRKEVQEIKKKISDLCIAFQKNVTEDKSNVPLTEAELEGVPDDVIKGLAVEEKDGVKYHLVTMKYPDVFPTLKYAKRETVRRKVELCYSARCKAENSPILEEIVSLRHKLAQLLGYPTHSHYILEIRMAKTPENVTKFYNTLKPKLDTLAEKELQVLLNLKKEESGDSFDNKINSWDFLYFDRLLNEKVYAVNEQEIKEYFPAEVVLTQTLLIYQELLGLKFVQVTGVSVWHPEVLTYEVYDKNSNNLIGHFYMDLYPRDGKYTHAAAFPLQKGCYVANGDWQLPTSAMVCNFAKGNPSLLRHDEVETFFHEFGHIMHGICAKAKYARFAGTSTERDFVECPSQMLENWCWDKEILRRLSSHHKTGQPLPDALIEKMTAAKNANSGLLNLRQVFYGQFDQLIHTQPAVDSQAIYNRLRTEITKTPPQPESNGAASFAHLVGGYDSSYYGYLWSKVFSADLFESFAEKGVMNPELGQRYREKILLPGGSKDGDEMLRDFLGRDPIMEPFIRSIGLA